jgi:HD-GYP domain-containing protein (c-di-GMP phosphodiesterase class II)
MVADFMIRKIAPGHVTIGMFVCGFGGSWFDHPFWRKKFVVSSQADADRIRFAAIPHVEIDDARGVGVQGSGAPPVLRDVAARNVAQHGRPDGRKARLSPAHDGAMGAALEKRHREQIEHIVGEARETMRGLFSDARMGKAIRTEDTVKLIDDIFEAVSRSPRIILDIVRLKKKDEYTFMHSVAVCALMINIARFLGKSEDEVRDYGQAGLLHDVGKMGIPEHILNKPGPLTNDEFITVRSHPEHGHGLLATADGVSDTALDVCLHHHEKQNGAGYPFGKGADLISEAASLGAICDVYDALTSNRIYRTASAPVEAVTAMWDSDGHFDTGLLFAFMHSITTFPEGMLVRLRSNRLGLIKAMRRKDTGPRVIAFYSTRDLEQVKPEELYLADGTVADSIVGLALPEQWNLGDWGKLRARLLGRRLDVQAR